MLGIYRRVIGLSLLLGSLPVWAGQFDPPVGISDEGGSISRPVYVLDCVGAGIVCTQSGITGTLTVAGGGGNSFETIAVPAGTNPVADSTTDTLTITETSFLTITGTAATDTIDITQVTTDLGTDGLIAANAVALGTDTTNNYVATVADDGTSTVTVVGSGSETAAVTLKVVDVSCTGCLGTTEIAGLDISADTNLAVSGTLATLTGDTISIKEGTLTDEKVCTYESTSTLLDCNEAETGTGSIVRATSPTIVTPAAFTTGGTITLAEDHSVALDPANSADNHWTGITVTATAGYTQALGDLVYLDPTDSRWEKTDANAASAADGDARGILGIVVVAGTDGASCTILLQGIIRWGAPAWTVNNPIYVSETAGAVTQTQPTTTDVVIRILGSALTADEMYFAPDRVWITHT